MLEVAVHPGSPTPSARREVAVELVGNDHPGIVRAVSGVLAEHGLSVTELETSTRDAPMAGGRLFEARALVTVPADDDLSTLRAALERIASEVLVDLTLVDAR
jgi:glycine cleavage system regulatory protein